MLFVENQGVVVAIFDLDFVSNVARSGDFKTTIPPWMSREFNNDLSDHPGRFRLDDERVQKRELKALIEKLIIEKDQHDYIRARNWVQSDQQISVKIELIKNLLAK